MLSTDEKERILAEQRETAFLAYRMELAATYDEGFAEGFAQGFAEGFAEGRALGQREALIELLESRFATLTSSARERIAGATGDEIDAWISRSSTALTLEDALA